MSNTQNTTALVIDTGAQIPPVSSLTGGLDIMGTGMTNTGTVDTHTGVISNTGTTATGVTLTGKTATGILFPEIRATRQEPTNAVFTGEIWDCGMNQPCRINVTFDPIFTGSFLSKNYICEVITATGTLTTCNPNTLYFSTGSSFSFHLTSKVDPSQSRTVSWVVRFESSAVSQNNSSTGITTGTGS